MGVVEAVEQTAPNPGASMGRGHHHAMSHHSPTGRFSEVWRQLQRAPCASYLRAGLSPRRAKRARRAVGRGAWSSSDPVAVAQLPRLSQRCVAVRGRSTANSRKFQGVDSEATDYAGGVPARVRRRWGAVETCRATGGGDASPDGGGRSGAAEECVEGVAYPVVAAQMSVLPNVGQVNSGQGAGRACVPAAIDAAR